MQDAAKLLYDHLVDVGYKKIDDLCKNLVTYVSMLKRIFHTAALTNGILLLNYYKSTEEYEKNYKSAEGRKVMGGRP